MKNKQQIISTVFILFMAVLSSCNIKNRIENSTLNETHILFDSDFSGIDITLLRENIQIDKHFKVTYDTIKINKNTQQLSAVVKNDNYDYYFTYLLKFTSNEGEKISFPFSFNPKFDSRIDIRLDENYNYNISGSSISFDEDYQALKKISDKFDKQTNEVIANKPIDFDKIKDFNLKKLNELESEWKTKKSSYYHTLFLINQYLGSSPSYDDLKKIVSFCGELKGSLRNHQFVIEANSFAEENLSYLYNFEIPEYESINNSDEISFSNKETLIYFWADWCKPCINSFPQLKDLADKGDYNVISIEVSSSKDKVTSIMGEYLFEWPQYILTEKGREIYEEKYGYAGFPNIMFIDNNGTVKKTTSSLP